MCEHKQPTSSELNDLKERWTNDPKLEGIKAPFLDHVDAYHPDTPIQRFGAYMDEVRVHRAAYERGELEIVDGVLRNSISHPTSEQ